MLNVRVKVQFLAWLGKRCRTTKEQKKVEKTHKKTAKKPQFEYDPTSKTCVWRQTFLETSISRINIFQFFSPQIEEKAIYVFIKCSAWLKYFDLDQVWTFKTDSLLRIFKVS